MLEKLEALGIDTTAGLTYCAEDEDFYIEMLDEYVSSDKHDALNTCLASDDITNYIIEVHALKSTSLTIGATTLSEEAKKLEFAGKEGNIAYIKDNHDRVMNMYKDILDGIIAAK